MEDSFSNWSTLQRKGNYCIVIIGDIVFNNSDKSTLVDLLINISKKNDYEIDNILIDPIPEIRKVVKGNSRIKNENVCIFKRI